MKLQLLKAGMVLGFAVVAMTAAVTVGTGQAAAAEGHYEEKKIQIQEGGPFDEDKQTRIQVGKKVKYDIKIYQDDFFGSSIINANAKIVNNAKVKVKAVYSISFHNKKGQLVGCHQGSWDLDPGEDVSYGSAIIYADAKSIATVTSYKLRTLAYKSKDK